MFKLFSSTPKPEQPKVNRLVLRKKQFKLLNKINKLVVKRGGDFIKLARDRKEIIHDLFVHFKSEGELSKEHLDRLKILIEDERALVEEFEGVFEDSSLIFTRLFEVAPDFLEKCAHEKFMTTKLSSYALCKKLQHTFPSLRKLYYLFGNYLHHMKERSRLEESLIDNKQSALLFRKSKLRELWHKDDEIFRVFEKHFSELKIFAEEVKRNSFNFVSVSTMGSLILLAYATNFIEESDKDTLSVFIFFFLSLGVMFYNFSVYFRSAEKYETKAEEELTYFD